MYRLAFVLMLLSSSGCFDLKDYRIIKVDTTQADIPQDTSSTESSVDRTILEDNAEYSKHDGFDVCGRKSRAFTCTGPDCMCNDEQVEYRTAGIEIGEGSIRELMGRFARACKGAGKRFIRDSCRPWSICEIPLTISDASVTSLERGETVDFCQPNPEYHEREVWAPDPTASDRVQRMYEGIPYGESLKLFTEHVHPYLVEACGSCHSRNPAKRAPILLAHETPKVAHDEIILNQKVFFLGGIERSRLILRLTQDSHNCPKSDCQSAGAKMKDVVLEKWITPLHYDP